MLSKTQVKEWFDRYKLWLHYYNCIALITIQQGFSGLKTAYLITFAEYFTFYIIGSILAMLQKNRATQQKTSFKAVILIIKTC
jgi:hypothetical protein